MNSDATQQIDITDHLGPVSYIAVEFPDGHPTPEGFARLQSLVDSGLILVIDLEFVQRGADGSLVTAPAGSFDASGMDLSAFEGADSGLLDREDLESVGHGLAQGSVLAVLVYEDLTLEPVLAAWAAGGARVVAEGPVDVGDLRAALESDTDSPPE